MSPKKIRVLLVEDNPADALIAQEGLAGSKMLRSLHVVTDGVEALDFLRRRGKHAEAPRPDLMLLDLNMPRMNGHEVLAEIKTDADLKHIPVIVLTTSQSREDISQAYGQRANCYISKPVDFEDFAKVVRTIETFWIQTAALPLRIKP